MPGGGVCAKIVAGIAGKMNRRNVKARNIGNIIIDSVPGTVRAIFIKPEKRGKPVPLESVQAVIGGLAGDHHTGPSRRREILLMSGAILDELKLAPGAVFENVVLDGLDGRGDRVRRARGA